LSDDARARAIALLEATYQFPVAYAVSVIIENTEEVFVQVRAAIEVSLDQPLPADAYQSGGQSSAGRYASHRFQVPCARPEDVLALYERLRQVKGVRSLL
jgi:putative lipoic acid-binding regulatory protein